MRRTATAVILLAMLAGACEPSLERSQSTRSPAGVNADARHVVVDTDLAFASSDVAKGGLSFCSAETIHGERLASR